MAQASTPETHYAKTVDGVHIAYAVAGEGPVDLVVMASGLGLGEIWRGKRTGSFLRRLASFSRLIVIDRRGTGLSDHLVQEHQLSLENRMEDVRAVMDEIGSSRAVLLGLEVGGFTVAAMFAATLPERTAGLIAYGATARVPWAPDYPFGFTPEQIAAEDVGTMAAAWGSEELAAEWMDSLYAETDHDPVDVTDFAAMMRAMGGPGDVARFFDIDVKTDVRELLPSIRIPTIVVHRLEDRDMPIEHGKYLAEHIPGAEFVELPGGAHAWDADDALTTEVGRFLATIRRDEIDFDRFLGTVLFTDIVDSTQVATSVGDRAWAELVTEHHRIVRGQLARYRGAEMDTAGDGFFATFDGPARAVRCALAIEADVRRLSIEVRAGVHTGEMQTIDGKTGGIAVVLGARIASLAGPSEVLVSQTVRDLVAGSGLVFQAAGEHELKGVPDRWQVYRVVE
jgi:pimeloyl-ACP methyl ester carboxylesterase